MSCCNHCIDAEGLFNKRLAQRELRSYRKSGPCDTTRLLLRAIGPLGNHANTLLDIGSGVGAIPHDLLSSGLSSAVVVDASAEYIDASQDEAARRGHKKRLTYYHGDFVELASTLAPADIVTLDRVICCYPDVEKLVESSVAKARHIYGLVYPRERWLTRTVVALENIYYRLRGWAFRTYMHPSNTVDTIIRRHGFRCTSCHRTILWQVVTYVRRGNEQSEPIERVR